MLRHQTEMEKMNVYIDLCLGMHALKVPSRKVIRS